jgi:hypothetical protein
MWTPRNIRLLIDQRKNRNNEYHFDYGRDKKEFWRSVAQRINRVSGTNFTHRQCSRKWASLVSAFNVNITLYYIHTPDKSIRTVPKNELIFALSQQPVIRI